MARQLLLIASLAGVAFSCSLVNAPEDPAPPEDEASGCTPPFTSIDNCGACGEVCAPENAEGATCADEVCSYGACEVGFGDCDDDRSNGCERDVQSDPQNCGDCGRDCAELGNATGVSCSDGDCGYTTCNDGFLDCDGDPSNGCEVDTQTDPLHCGGCNADCADEPGYLNVATYACAGGMCDYATCVTGFDDCDTNRMNGCEAAVDSLTSCGMCNVPCTPANATGPTCAGGICDYTTCIGSFEDCNGNTGDGCETDTTTTALHCGGCNLPCNPNEVCGNGSCVYGSCAGIKADDGNAVSGSYVISLNGVNTTVYCDMTGQGVTYIELGFGQYDLAYAGYTPVTLADLQNPTIQQAFVQLYNQQGGGAINLQIGWNSGNCCFKFAEHIGQEIWVGIGGHYIYPATQPNQTQCSTGYTSATYSFFQAEAGPHSPMVMPTNYFQTFPASAIAGCSTATNPGWFWRRI